METIIEIIKNLRKESGAGVQACRQAYEECGHDYRAALLHLNEKMAQEASKLAGREAARGWLETYSHGDGRLAVVVEINTETDFAAQSADVRSLGHELALQIAAATPIHVCAEEIPPDVISDLVERTLAEARSAGKPETIAGSMVEGRINKFKTRNVLMEQPYIRDEDLTVGQLINQVSSRIGEKIQVKRFVRWEMEEPQTG